MDTTEIMDLASGFTFGMAAGFHTPWWPVCAILCAIFWWMGGRGILGYNTWRRIGCPAILFLFTAYNLWNIAGFFAQWGALSIGYGDENSWLYKIFGKWTKAIWYLIVYLALIPSMLK